MPSTMNEVLAAALSLSTSERGLVAGRLIESLDEDVDEAWEEEIGRRLEQIDSGKVALIPWDEARRVIRGMVSEVDPG